MDYYESRDNVCMYEETNQVNQHPTEIQSFFTGKSVFITGSTGLIGSLILENILRKCSGVNKIYLLLRSKKGKTVAERAEAALQSEIFGEVHRKYKNIRDKIVVLEGDCSLPKCGLSEASVKLLEEEVDLVYHAAAALRMDEHIRTSYYMNTRATRDLLEIALKMKKLKAFMYISTAYSQSPNPEIREKFYEAPFTCEQIRSLCERMNDQQLTAMTPKIVGKYRNTYIFTKAVTESVVKNYVDKIPAAVVRPSIVIGCHTEPLAGWINNVYGPTGVSLGTLLGVIRVWYGGPHKVADIIPADKFVNTLIAASWEIATETCHGKQKEMPPVYNVVSSCKSPQTWLTYNKGTDAAAKRDQITTVKIVRDYSFRLEESSLVYTLIVIFRHLIPGLLLDLLLRLGGKSPMLIKGFIKICVFNYFLSFYSLNEWKFYQDNVDQLWTKLSKFDRRLFNFDMTNFNWTEYHSRTIRAIVVYIVKDDLSEETLIKARNKYLMIQRIKRGIRLVFFGLLCTWLWKTYSTRFINILTQFNHLQLSIFY